MKFPLNPLKINKTRFLAVILGFAFFLLNLDSIKAQQDSITYPKHVHAKIEFGPEYFWPSSDIHTIRTISLNAFFWTRYFKKTDLNISLGITTSYARGTIFDWYEIDPELTFLKTSAWGVGPVFHIQYPVFIAGKFSIEGEANGGIIFYNRNFPTGGSFYNFMFRAGAVMGYRINNKFSLKAGYKWMHVSNGKGAVPKNPTYESLGVSLTLTRYFLK